MTVPTGRSAPSNVLHPTFSNPFRISVRRQCRTCRDWITVDLLNGATAPPEGAFWCAECHPTVEASAERVLALVAPQQPLDAA